MLAAIDDVIGERVLTQLAANRTQFHHDVSAGSFSRKPTSPGA